MPSIGRSELVSQLASRVRAELEKVDSNNDGAVSRFERSSLPEDVRGMADATANYYLDGGDLPIKAYTEAYTDYAERAVGRADRNRDGVISTGEQGRLPRGVYKSMVAVLANSEPVAPTETLEGMYRHFDKDGWSDEELNTFIDKALDSGELNTYGRKIWEAVLHPKLPTEVHAGETFYETLAWYTDATAGGHRDGKLTLPELRKALSDQAQKYLSLYGKPGQDIPRRQAHKFIEKLRLLESEITSRASSGQGAYFPYESRDMMEINPNSPWNKANTVDSSAEFQKDVIDASYDKPVLVKYGLPYCMHCLLLENLGSVPAVDDKYDGQIAVRKVWWNPNDPSMADITSVAADEGVTSSPYFILYKDGEPVRSGYAFPDETGDGLESLLQGYVTEP